MQPFPPLSDQRKFKRRKIKIEKVEKKESRKVTFTKRRHGLFSKAEEFCNLFESDIAIVTFSLAGKPFCFGHPSADSIIDHFLNNNGASSSDNSPSNEYKPGHWALPIESMDLDGLKRYKVSLELMKSKVANRLEEMKDRRARARDFIGLLNAPSTSYSH